MRTVFNLKDQHMSTTSDRQEIRCQKGEMEGEHHLNRQMPGTVTDLGDLS